MSVTLNGQKGARLSDTSVSMAMPSARPFDDAVVIYLKLGVKEFGLEFFFAQVLEKHDGADEYPAQCQRRHKNTRVE